MKKFIYNIIFFSLLLILCAFFLDFLIENGLKETESRLYKSWNKILEGKVNADIIILGNSRAYRQYNPKIISDIAGKSVWNLGMDAYSFNIQKMKFDVYRKFNTKPKLLIIDVNYLFLSYTEIKHEREQFLPYLDNSSFKNFYIHKAFTRKETYIPLIKYFGYRHEITIGLAEIFHLHHFNENENNGYWEKPDQWNENEFDAMIKNHEKIQMVNDEKVVSEFRNFIIESEAEGINVFLVWSPLNKEGLKVLINNKKDRYFFRQLADDLHIFLLDYSDDDICYNRAYFSNVTHLNSKGAELFSFKLANDLNGLLKREPFIE